MPLRMLEVHTPAAIVVIDRAGAALRRIGPVRHLALPDPRQHLVELRLADQEGVVLVRQLAVLLLRQKIQRYPIAQRNRKEGPERPRRSQAEYAADEAGRALRIPAPHDGVIELHAHGLSPSLCSPDSTGA